MVEEFPKTCTVTIQGGGVYGLTLLGQLAAVEKAGFKPVAYAGASAGAIVATLAWAGYSTDEIRKKFEQHAKQKTLLGMIGPFGRDDRGNEVTPSRLNAVIKGVGTLFDQVVPAHPKSGIAEEPATSPRAGLLRRGWRSFGNIFRAAGRTAGNLSVAAGGYVAWNRWGTGIAERLQGALSTFISIWQWRGVFPGHAFEEFIDGMLRAKLSGTPVPGYKPTFGDFFSQFYGANRATPHPALFLTVSNVGRGDVDLIDSLSYAYKDIPVSRAVRASMSFPLFFQPVRLDMRRDARNGRPLLINNCDVDAQEMERLESALCVDGGMVANFPLWLIAREVREVLYRAGRNASAFDSLVQPLRPLEGVGFRLMFHLGLRLTPDLCEDGIVDPNPRLEADNLDAPGAYAAALLDLAVSGVRNSLEGALVDRIGRTIIVNQAYSQSAAPGGVLDFAKVTPRAVNEMYRAGLEAGTRCFSKFGFRLPAGRQPNAEPNIEAPTPIDRLLDRLRGDIESQMRTVRERAEAPPGILPLDVRVNIFVRIQNEMIMRYASGMHNDADACLELGIEQGLVGLSLRKRRLVLCILNEARKQSFDFRLTSAQESRLRSDRDWLLCVPIMDPLEPITTRDTIGTQALVTADSYPFLAVADGAEAGIAIGMLCVDACLGWDRDAKELFDEHHEIRAAVAAAEVAAIAAGRLLGQAFAHKSPN